MDGNYRTSRNNFIVSSRNNSVYCGSKNKFCKYATVYGQCSTRYCTPADKSENENVIAFAEYLKDYARQVQENGYDGIGELDIDEKLKEFLQ